jgi:hypothetical protein
MATTPGPRRSEALAVREWPASGAGAAEGASGISVTSVSVVSTIAAMLAAFSSAERVTFAGSMMPALSRSV